MRYVADTHALLWYLQDNPHLSENARQLFDQDEIGSVVIPTIVLAELLYISRKTKFPISFKKIVSALEQSERFEVYPLTVEVLLAAEKIHGLEMHDTLIVATCKVLDFPLMTVDHDVIDSKEVRIINPIPKN